MVLSGTLLFFGLEIFTSELLAPAPYCHQSNFGPFEILDCIWRHSSIFSYFFSCQDLERVKWTYQECFRFSILEYLPLILLAPAPYCHQSNLGPIEMLHCIWRHSQFLLAKFSYFKGNSSASLPLTALMHKTKNNGNIVTSPYAILQR